MRWPTVRARMRERIIVNVRVPAAGLASTLPSRLRPQEVEGWSVVPFCLLDLRAITVAPLPTRVGWSSRSCAVRAGVLDADGSPAVFVRTRQTDSRVGAAFTRLGFSAPHEHVDVRLTSDRRATASIEVVRRGSPLVSAELGAGGPLRSEVFADVDAFAAFLAAGVRSFGGSRHAGRLTVLDLHKSDAGYQPLTVRSVSGSFVDEWAARGGVVDSALRTVDARYEWDYHGLVDDTAD